MPVGEATKPSGLFFIVRSRVNTAAILEGTVDPGIALGGKMASGFLKAEVRRR
jgi:hypothetical protein